MKKITFFIFLTASLFLSCDKSGQVSSSKEAEMKKKLLGYWILSRGESYAINSAGEEILTATLKPGASAYAFREDGTATGYDLTGNFPEEDFNWELSKVESHDGVYSGTLSLFNDKTKANAGQLFIGADGKLSYSIAYFDNTPPELVLETIHVPVYPHKEIWVEYKYVKK